MQTNQESNEWDKPRQQTPHIELYRRYYRIKWEIVSKCCKIQHIAPEFSTVFLQEHFSISTIKVKNSLEMFLQEHFSISIVFLGYWQQPR